MKAGGSRFRQQLPWTVGWCGANTLSLSPRRCSVGWTQALALESDLVGDHCVTRGSYFTLLSPRGWLGELKKFEDRSISYLQIPCSVSCTNASESSLELAKKMLISWLPLDLHVTWATLSKLQKDSKTKRSECVLVTAGGHWGRADLTAITPGKLARLGGRSPLTAGSRRPGPRDTNTSPRVGAALFGATHRGLAPLGWVRRPAVAPILKLEVFSFTRQRLFSAL